MKNKIIKITLLGGMIACCTITGCSKQDSADKTFQTDEGVVALCDYASLTYSTVKPEGVTDEAVKEAIDSELDNASTYEKIKDRAVKDGDTINIDYIGTVDGKEFEGGNTNNQGTDLTIGSAYYIDGFEDQLIGAKPGDKIEINVTFPEDYGNDALNGKDAVFKTTINYINGKKNTPELTDVWVENNTDYENVNDYTKAKKLELANEKNKEYDSSVTTEIESSLLENCIVTNLTEDDVDKCEAEIKNGYLQYAESMGIDYSEFCKTYLGAEEDAVATQIEDEANRQVTLHAIVDAIAEKEDLELSDKEWNAYIADMALQYGYESSDSLIKKMEDVDAVSTEKFYAEKEKVINYLKDKATFVKTETESETE